MEIDIYIYLKFGQKVVSYVPSIFNSKILLDESNINIYRE